MADENTVPLEVLIQIREELAGLNRTTAGLREAKKEATSLGSLLRQGLGIGSGMQAATMGINLLRNSLKASVGEAFRLAAEIKGQSSALGLTTEAYQVMRYELLQAGLGSDRLTQALSRQTESMAEARSGVGATADAYKALGLTAGELEQMRPEERLAAIAGAVERSTDRTKAFQAAGQLLGNRGLPQLLAALQNLARNGYDATAEAARKAGRVLAGETIEMLDQAKKRVDNFRETTLPIAAGTVLGWVQGAMDWVGKGAANAVNLLQGRPTGTLGDLRTPPPPPKAPTGSAMADAEAIVAVRLSNAEAKQSAFASAALLTEEQRRKALLPVLDEQAELLERLINLRFGEKGKSLPADGSVTEEELAIYQQRNELEARLTAIRQQRMEAVDRPLLALSRELEDSTGVAQSTLSGGLTAGIGSLSSGIWNAFQGTAKFGDAWRGVASIAGQALTEILVKLMVIRPLLSMFGLGGGGPAGNVSVGASVTSGGGSTFLTHGRTQLTLGDNPGGVELVNVIPLSGVGRTTVNGRAMAMAGGGSLVAAGGSGTPVVINQTLNVSTGLAASIRAEMVGMMPAFREMAVDSYREAMARGNT